MEGDPFENKLMELDREALVRVEDALKKINIALNLNRPKLRSAKIPPKLKRLLIWKKALERWKEKYGAIKNPDIVFAAERLGAFYELCTTIE